MEYQALQSKLPEIQRHYATLILLSPQLPSSSNQIVVENGFEFPILFFDGNEVGRKYGLAFKLSEEFDAANLAFGTDLSVINGDNSNELPIPAIYVINQQGIIIYAFVKPSWAERAKPEYYIGLLK